MKKILCMLLAVLLLASLGTAAFAEGEKEVYKENGLTLTLPEEFNEENLKGTWMPYPYGECDDGVFYITFIYYAMPEEELDILLEKSMDEFTEADLALIRSKQAALAAVYGLDAVAMSAENAALLEEEKDSMTELAKAGDVTFYKMDLSAESEEFMEGIAPAYREEFRSLQAALDDALKNAEFYVPVIPGKALVGKTISFKAMDLDGKAVRSEEIFKEHEITMVNVWATWCHNCVEEMTGLGEMAGRLAEKNVAVVGICMDADDSLEECRAILKEHGADYLNLMPVEGLDDLLEWDGALPTSYFFDSEGRLLCKPFRGAPMSMDAYEEVIDGLLEGKEGAAKTPDSPHTAANDEGVYRVIVSDTDGNLVKGAKVQFCSDTTCMLGTTDENGVAAFQAEEGGVYTVHVLKVPAGYEKHSGEYKTEDTYCDLYISLKKAA